MRSGYDLLLKAQSVESMKELCPEAIFACLQRDDSFDVSSRLWERLAFLIYQDCDFGLNPPTTAAENVLSTINRLCKSRIIHGFPVEGETFVGSSKDPNSPSHSRERVLCATLLSSSKDEIPSVLSSFSEMYTSSANFAQKLLDNDDRFLTTMLILLPQIETIPCDSVFHPVAIFLEAMNLISYDCAVLIDWLNSELAACSVIFRVLKSNINQKTAKLWKDYVPKQVDQWKKVKKWREELHPTDAPSITLKIIEIVGEEQMTKLLSFNEQKTEKVAYSEPTALQNSGSFCRWASAVDELRSRLRKLHDAKLVAEKYKFILKMADKFCATYLNK